mgnify:CR=1 FL=1
MLSSERLSLQKSQSEVSGRFDDLKKSVETIKDEIKFLKKEVTNISNNFKELKESNDKTFSEIYSFLHKLERVYYNGLIGEIPFDENSESNNDVKIVRDVRRDIFK